MWAVSGCFLMRAWALLIKDNSDNENFNLLLSAGADVPLSDQFTLNAQANVGVLNDTEFGVTVGVGYNFGRLIR